jgi:hypothetical protein
MNQKAIYVFADWDGLEGPRLLGTLWAALSRGKEIFSFQYNGAWLKSGPTSSLDPRLGLVLGPQYPKQDHPSAYFCRPIASIALELIQNVDFMPLGGAGKNTDFDPLAVGVAKVGPFNCSLFAQSPQLAHTRCSPAKP